MARFILNPESSKPLYKQIVDYFENSIINGSLQTGNALPAERDLAVQLGVNRSTVTTAYAELRANGYITSRQGSGTRVSPEAADLIPDHSMTWNKLRNQHLADDSSLYGKHYDYLKDPSLINLISGSIAEDLCLAKSAHELTPFTTKLDNAPPTKERVTHSICRFMKQSCLSEHMVLTSSLEQAMLLSVKCFLNPGDAIAMEEPVNYSHINILIVSGIRVIKYSTDKPLTQTMFQKESIKLVIANSNNIYDHSLSHSAILQQRKKLLSQCEKVGIPILEIVETSLLTNSVGNDLPSFFELGSNRELVVQIGHFTGIAPGLSLGWVLGPDHVVNRIQEVQMQLCMTPPPVLLEIVDNILNSDELHDHIDTIQEQLYVRKQKVLHKLNTLKDHITILQIEDPTSIWFDFKPSLNRQELFDTLLDSNVLLVPHKQEHAVRIRLPLSYVTKDQLLEGTSRLISVLNTLHVRQFAVIY